MNTYCSEGTSHPVMCPYGSVTYYVGATSEQECYYEENYACPAGMYMNEDNCLDCMEGFYCPDGVAEPVVCPMNAYCEDGAMFPTMCPEGMITDEDGATSESDCVEVPDEIITEDVTEVENEIGDIEDDIEEE